VPVSGASNLIRREPGVFVAAIRLAERRNDAPVGGARKGAHASILCAMTWRVVGLEPTMLCGASHAAHGISKRSHGTRSTWRASLLWPQPAIARATKQSHVRVRRLDHIRRVQRPPLYKSPRPRHASRVRPPTMTSLHPKTCPAANRPSSGDHADVLLLDQREPSSEVEKADIRRFCKPRANGHPPARGGAR
jgi:hypothetical protein